MGPFSSFLFQFSFVAHQSPYYAIIFRSSARTYGAAFAVYLPSWSIVAALVVRPQPAFPVHVIV